MDGAHRQQPIIYHRWDHTTQPNDPAVVYPTWSGVKNVTAFSCRRGREYELDRVQAGLMNVTIFDDAGTFNPSTGTVQPLQRWSTYALTSPHLGNLVNDSNARLYYDPVGYYTAKSVNPLTLPTANLGWTALSDGTPGTPTVAATHFLGASGWGVGLAGGPASYLALGRVAVNQRVPVAPSTTYFVSAWVQVTNGPTGCDLVMGTTDGAVTGTTIASFAMTNATWKRVYGTYTTGPDESVLRPIFKGTGTAMAAGQIYVDAFVVEVAGRTNLCTNPSFENGTTTGWVAGSNATLSVATGHGYDGGNAMLLTKGGSSGGNAYAVTNFTTDVVRTVTLSAQVRSPSGVPVSGTVVLQDNGVQTVVPFTTVGTGYQPVSVTRALTTTTNPSAYVTADTAPAGSTLEVDHVLIEFTDAVGDYFDGDSDTCWWTGAHQASTSYMPNAAFPGTATSGFPPPVRYNGVGNPSFETGTSGWAGTLLYTTSPGCPYIAGDSTGYVNTSNQAGEVSYAGIPATASVSTLVSCWVRVSAGTETFYGTVTGTLTLRVDWYDGTNTFLSSSSQARVTSNTEGWVQIAFTPVAPSTAATVNVNLLWDGAISGTIYFDGFLVESYGSADAAPYSPGGSTTRPYWDNLQGARVQPIFCGYVERWPNAVDDQHRSIVTPVVIDPIAVMGSIDVDSEYGEMIRQTSGLVSYWPLGESNTAAIFGEASGTVLWNSTYTSQNVTNSSALTIYPGGAVAVGGQPGPQQTTKQTTNGGLSGGTVTTNPDTSFGDAGTAVEFTNVASYYGAPLWVQNQRAAPPGQQSVAVECMVYPTAAGLASGSTVFAFTTNTLNDPGYFISAQASAGATSIIMPADPGQGSMITLRGSLNSQMEMFYAGVTTNNGNGTWTVPIDAASSEISSLAYTHPASSVATVSNVPLRVGWNASSHLYAVSAGTGIAPVIVDGGALTLNTWNHVFVERVWNAGASRYDLAIWVNSVRVAVVAGGAGTANFTWGDVQIGGMYRYGSGFPGRIAHVATYAGQVSPDDIAGRYWHGFGGGRGETVSRRMKRYLSTYLNSPSLIEGYAVLTAATTGGSTTVFSVDNASSFKANDSVLITNQAYSNSAIVAQAASGAFPSYPGYSADVATVSSVDVVANTITFTAAPTHSHSAGDMLLVGSQVSSNAALTTSSKLLPALQTVEEAEGGLLFARSDGVLYWMLRRSRYTSTMTIKARFSNSEGTGIPFLTGSQWDYDPTLVYNRITVDRQDTNTSTTTVLSNSASIKKFFRRDLPLTMPLASNVEATGRGSEMLGWYDVASERIEEIKVDLLANPGAAARVLALDIGDHVSVTKLAPSGAILKTILCIVEEIQHDRAPDTHTVTFRVSPAFTSTLAYDTSTSYH